MIAIATVLLLGYIAQQSLMNVYVIYADYRYHWTDRTVGFSLATIGVCTAIYGALLVKPIVAKLGERGAMTLGLIGGAIGYSMFGLSKTGVLFWLGIPLLNMMSFTWPAAQSLLSRKTSPSEQGQLQGAINSLRGIAGLSAPASSPTSSAIPSAPASTSPARPSTPPPPCSSSPSPRPTRRPNANPRPPILSWADSEATTQAPLQTFPWTALRCRLTQTPRATATSRTPLSPVCRTGISGSASSTA